MKESFLNREVYGMVSKLSLEEIKKRDDQKLEEVRLQKIKEGYEEEGKSLTLKAVLDKIDFGICRSLFQDVVERCGLDPKTLNFLGPERIFSSVKRDNYIRGWYYSDHNVIVVEDWRSNILNQSEAEYISERRFARIYGSFEILVLGIIIHEQVHATSKIVETSDYLIPFGAPVDTSGYREDKMRKNFHSFNEGVTEKLSRELTSQYLSRSSWGEREKETYIRNKNKLPSYQNEVELVNLIIKKIAEDTQQSERVVWEAIVQGAYTGVNFDDPLIKSLFSEAIGINFIEDLKQTYIDPEAKISTSKILSNYKTIKELPEQEILGKKFDLICQSAHIIKRLLGY